MAGKPFAAGLFSLLCLVPGALSAAGNIEWESEIYPNNQIFPSLVIGTATVKPDSEIFAVWDGNHIGDAQGIVGASADGISEGSKVVL